MLVLLPSQNSQPGILWRWVLLRWGIWPELFEFSELLASLVKGRIAEACEWYVIWSRGVQCGPLSCFTVDVEFGFDQGQPSIPQLPAPLNLSRSGRTARCWAIHRKVVDTPLAPEVDEFRLPRTRLLCGWLPRSDGHGPVFRIITMAALCHRQPPIDLATCLSSRDETRLKKQSWDQIVPTHP